MIEEGIWGVGGERKIPKIIRLGMNYSKEVEKYSVVQKLKKIKGKNYLKKMREEVKKADLVFSTLNFIGSSSIQNLNLDFETVIIDEACKAKEISVLIPLQYLAKRLILIGDPK